MRYILDLDHTLFDYGRFVGDVMRDGRLDTLITPGIWEHYDPRAYLFPDVLPWLSERSPEELVLLTMYTPHLGSEARAFQEEKVRRLEFADTFGVVRVMDGEKGPHVAELASRSDGCTVFVDDSPVHLQSAREHAPAVTCLEMRRPEYAMQHAETAPVAPPIASLAEIDAMMQKL